MVKLLAIARKRRGRRYPFLSDHTTGKAACFRCRAAQPYIRHLCAYRCCTEFYCAECRRYLMGVGQAGCRCDDYPGAGNRGHRTKAEQRRRTPPFKPSRRIRNR